MTAWCKSTGPVYGAWPCYLNNHLVFSRSAFIKTPCVALIGVVPEYCLFYRERLWDRGFSRGQTELPPISRTVS